MTESIVEDAALAWLQGLGWQVLHGPDIAPGEPFAERADYAQVVLEQRLRDALARLNPELPPDALGDAFRRITRPQGSTLEMRNRAFHRLLVEGVTVEYRTPAGAIRGAQARVINFESPDENDWLAVNQFSVVESIHTRRPDVVLFVNGLPLVLIELKNPADENATVWTAYQQFQTYKAELPTLFAFNELLVASDGLETRMGTLTAGPEWFKPWRTITGESLAPATMTGLQVTLEGVFNRRRLLNLIGHFVVFEDDGSALAKKVAGYHQFHAVNVAVSETLRAIQVRDDFAVVERRGRYEAGARPGGARGDRRVGVIWHTQGSGKSLSMVFYAGRVIREPAMENPTIVVLTDRNDLDDQLFGTFSRCQDLLRQPPVQAASREDLRDRLSVNAGGVIFTTIQKFLPDVGVIPRGVGGQAQGPAPTIAAGSPGPVGGAGTTATGSPGAVGGARTIAAGSPGPVGGARTIAAGSPGPVGGAGTTAIGSPGAVRVARTTAIGSPGPVGVAPALSNRRNIVVIADEAHRSQYDFIDGYARHMRDALPNASFIGFTGTPLELTDKNTRAVFGDYISVYDIRRAVEDQATVPIYYESRLAKLDLDEAAKPRIDPDFDEVTEGEEIERKEKLKSKWAQLAAVVGSDKRLALVAQDLVNHFETRLEALEGKALVVCMSRQICMDLHDQIAKLRPDWVADDDGQGTLKVVMTGNASEGPRVAHHARNKARREALAKRFRDPNDSLQMVIVRDMWLTGFDAPSLHTMYVDKPMRGHGLMQAIARVNRVFRDKPGGLVVDYLGLAHELKAALATYTESGGAGKTAIDQQEAVAVMLEKHEICCGLFHGFDWSVWTTGTPQERLSLLPSALEHILAQEDGRDRLLRVVHELSLAFALSVPHDEALRIGDDVGFFQTVRASLAKRAPGDARPQEHLDLAVRQIVSRAVASEGVVDIFRAAGLDKPDISILSEAFLADVRGMPQRNLAVELLSKLLAGEIRLRRRKNVVQARSFAEMLEQALRRYQNRAIEAAQVIEELIELARQMREAHARGEDLGLSEDELAFYDALGVNDSAVQVLGDETLRAIAQELVRKVRDNASIDWTIRETVRAKLRVMVKRVLRKYGYPPDKQESATALVLEQAEALCGERVGA